MTDIFPQQLATVIIVGQQQKCNICLAKRISFWNRSKVGAMGKIEQDNLSLVLDQYREDSEYNDFVGNFYHFPSKYLNMLSTPGTKFVYYEPKKKGDGK
jgi:hypothetical protein